MERSSLKLFILVSFIFACTYALYTPSDKVVILTKENFAKEILFTAESSVVEFYAPWCGHCKSLAPEYKKAANNLDGIVKIAAIDCDQEKELCGAFGIKGFPTIKHFPSELGKKEGNPWKEPTDYQGPRSAGAIVKFALSNLKSFVVKVKAESELESRKEPIALLFTEKKTTSDLYKGLSCHFKGRLDLAEINSSQKDLVNKFNVKKFPTLIVYGGSAGTEGKFFEGKIGYRSLQKFLTPFAKAPQQPQQPPSSSESPSEPPPPPNPKILHNVNSEEEFNTVCLSKKGLCVVAFMDSYEKERHQELLKQLEAVVEKQYKNFHIIWIEGPPQEALYNAFKLGGGFPALAVYAPHKKRVVPYLGSFSEESISEFLDTVLRGASSYPVDSLPPFVKPEVFTPDADDDEL
eukprot:TRINITY_DN219_c0_g1_i1.p1 TRINITY_DN219_c0_g1~~TRINITY_DN219_c0_g1_i1.p1  ORF type:complete len:406 (-),score=156.20 TRINITY_DN219_c0_g1_i1:29-1246(-)